MALCFTDGGRSAAAGAPVAALSYILNTELCPCLTITECLHFLRRFKGASRTDLPNVATTKRLRDVKHNYSDIISDFDVLGTPA